MEKKIKKNDMNLAQNRLFIFLFFVVALSANADAQTANQNQPFLFQTKRLIETLDYLGTPVSPADKLEIENIIAKNEEESRPHIQKALDKYALFSVVINPESRVSVQAGAAKPILQQNGWNTFLIKIENQAGITAKLQALSEQAKRDYDGGDKIYDYRKKIESKTVTKKNTADRGTGGFSFNCGKATQDIGFRNEADILFDCVASQKIKLEVLDENSRPATASFIITDKQGNIYPSQTKRLAPDFFFQQQVYRAHNETIDLPAGEYNIEYGRGPEYLTQKINFTVTENKNQLLKISLKRWIDPSKFGWYSGDHHIHAAGCSHYTTPTQGVNPEDMMRHIEGEAVNVGSVLTWGPGYYHQKQFFEGKDNKLSTDKNLLRYDLEISGFPSSHAGHIVLLRLKEQDYPGTKVLEDWPTYTIPILRWAKKQGAVTGYAHSGLGLEVKNDSLPNYEMPRFDGIGANEYIVSVTQNLVDFISAMDTPPPWELNIWYNTLNCGFRTRISGESDFPCISDDIVAHGRSSVKLD